MRQSVPFTFGHKLKQNNNRLPKMHKQLCPTHLAHRTMTFRRKEPMPAIYIYMHIYIYIYIYICVYPANRFIDI